jgi:hypothetical protein
MRRKQCFCYLLTPILLIVWPLSSRAQSGALTLSRGLDQLTQEAQTIVRGYVVTSKVEPHLQLTNLTTVRVTISVSETLKGSARKSLEFRQYVWNVREQVGAAEYRKGEELLLLLGPVSEYGLTSPAGLEQGRFRILRDAKGQAVAVNGRGNVGLLQSVEQRARDKGLQLSPRTTALIRQAQVGPIALDDLEDAIRAFGRQK